MHFPSCASGYYRWLIFGNPAVLFSRHHTALACKAAGHPSRPPNRAYLNCTTKNATQTKKRLLSPRKTFRARLFGHGGGDSGTHALIER